MRMYKRLEFESKRRCSTLAEAVVASEGRANLPSDFAEREFLARTGLIMVKRETSTSEST